MNSQRSLVSVRDSASHKRNVASSSGLESDGTESRPASKRPRYSKTLAEDAEEVRDMYDNLPQLEKDFEVLSKIGEGTFSSVYLARCKSDPEGDMVAIKNLVPTSSCTRIENEIYCLQKMGGRSHVISMLGFIRNQSHIALILPYFKHEKFTDYFALMSVSEVRGYMKALLESLRNVHSHGIIHRDVKPSNFLYDRSAQRYQLVDFGLAHLETQTKEERGSIPSIMARTQPVAKKHYHHEVKERHTDGRGTSTASGSRLRNVPVVCPVRHRVNETCERCIARPNQVAPRAGTPGFRAPEVLMKHPLQTTAVDIWSAGVILLCLLSRRYPFFRAHDDMSAMAQIVGLFGSSKCTEAAKSLGKTLVTSPEIQPMDLKRLCENYRASSVKESQSAKAEKSPKKDSNLHLPESAYSLMYRCLDLNPQSRITAEDALKHEFLTDRHKR